MLQNSIHEAWELCKSIFDAHWQNLPLQRTKRCGQSCEVPIIWMQRHLVKTVLQIKDRKNSVRLRFFKHILNEG